MSRTYRNIKYAHFIRRPRHKWKLLAGMPVHSKAVITDYDDQPVAAIKECRNRVLAHIKSL